MASRAWLAGKTVRTPDGRILIELVYDTRIKEFVVTTTTFHDYAQEASIEQAQAAMDACVESLEVTYGTAQRDGAADDR